MTSPVLQMALEALKLTISAQIAPDEWQLDVFETAIEKCRVVLPLLEAAIQQQPEPVPLTDELIDAHLGMAYDSSGLNGMTGEKWDRIVARRFFGLGAGAALGVFAPPSLQQQEGASTDGVKASSEAEPIAWTVAGEVRNWARDFSKYRTQHYVRPVYAHPAPSTHGAPVVATANPSLDQGPCAVCGKPWREHGSYPVYESHNYTPAPGVVTGGEGQR